MEDSGYPKISIITVCFNAEKELEETVKSVLAQNYPVIDFIIIDGGSTDGTVEVIKKYATKLKYWVSEPDKGIYDAMNKGWAIAELNSFVLYLGAGDKILTLPKPEELDLKKIYYGNALLGDDKLFVSKKDFRLKLGNTLHHQSLLIPKSLHKTPPFNIKYKVYADFDFNQRLLKNDSDYVKADDLQSYILPDGFSQHHKTFEWFYIIRANFGLSYALLGYVYFYFQKSKKLLS